MSAIIALVILTGAGCSSPVQHMVNETVAYQVPCAIVIREQSANPFKIAQQPNVITPVALKATAQAKPRYTYKPKKQWKKKKRKTKK